MKTEIERLAETVALAREPNPAYVAIELHRIARDHDVSVSTVADLLMSVMEDR